MGLPNRFGLALAAAARVRALARGSGSRIDVADLDAIDLALREIAAGAFKSSELASFITGSGEASRLAASGPAIELRDGSASGRCRHTHLPSAGEGSLATRPMPRNGQKPYRDADPDQNSA
nr:DNA-directed RNA polymerase subunit omega [Rhizobium azibense]